VWVGANATSSVTEQNAISKQMLMQYVATRVHHGRFVQKFMREIYLTHIQKYTVIHVVKNIALFIRQSQTDSTISMA